MAQVAKEPLAGDNDVQTDSVDGDKLIKDLANDRYLFNKSLISHTNETMPLPEPQSIIGTQSTITFGGYEYVILNKQVIEVKGIMLSKTALTLLSDKLNLLDRFQKQCANKVNAEYAQENRNLQYIKTLDRQYFSALNQFADITEDIAQLSKRPKASITIEMALRKIETPSSDNLISDDKAAMVAEVIKK